MLLRVSPTTIPISRILRQQRLDPIEEDGLVGHGTSCFADVNDRTEPRARPPERISPFILAAKYSSLTNRH